MDRQRLSRFDAVLDELPQDCRTAFRLHGIDGLTYTQIAAQLGISVSMVYKHLSHIRIYSEGLTPDSKNKDGGNRY